MQNFGKSNLKNEIYIYLVNGLWNIREPERDDFDFVIFFKNRKVTGGPESEAFGGCNPKNEVFLFNLILCGYLRDFMIK